MRGKKRRSKTSGGILLEKLIILLIQANGVLTPELLWLVHGTPFQAARLEFRTVLVEWAVEFRKKAQGVVKEIQRTRRLYTSQLPQSGNMSQQNHSASTRVRIDLICIFAYLSSQSNWCFLGVPEILHTLSQPLQQELDVLCDVLIIILLLFKIFQLFQHLALNHGQSVLLPGLPLCCLFQEILGQMTRTENKFVRKQLNYKQRHFVHLIGLCQMRKIIKAKLILKGTFK